MKFHSSLIDRLVRVYETYGGHREEGKLRSELLKLDLVPYERTTGEKILVESSELKKKALQIS